MSEENSSTVAPGAILSPGGNPANTPLKRVTEASRIPMSLPSTKLSVPEIPGYYLYWFLGQNIARAQKAGYEFVTDEEVDVVNTGLADDASKQGSTDLGSRISAVAGGTIEGTAEPQRLYLMKLRQEWRDQDVKALEAVNERVAAAIRGGVAQSPGGGPEESPIDRAKRYMKKGQDLFIPKRR